MDTEERFAAIEARLDKIEPIVKGRGKTLRNMRAAIIGFAFLGTVGVLSLNGAKYSKSEGFSVDLGKVKVEAIVLGLVMASLVVDQDTGQAKIIDKAIARILGK